MFKSLTVLFFISIICKSFALSPAEMIKKADQIRNPAQSFYMQVEVIDSSNYKNLFDVFTKGKDKTIIKTLAPKHSIGRNLLMLKEHMWLYIPNLGRAVRVSLSQKLSGQAANGDISRMRWYGDYQVKLEKETPKQIILFLKANKKGLTYQKIRVFLDKIKHYPLKAEYLALSGKHLKTAIFTNYQKIADRMRPSTIIISDANNPKRKSQINILKMKKKPLPDSIFNKMNLK